MFKKASLFLMILVFGSSFYFAAMKPANSDPAKPHEFSAIEHQQDEFSDPKHFVDSISNEKTTLIFEAEGDLNGDGLKDWAGVFTKRKVDKEIFDGKTEVLFNQLFVLTQEKNGKYIIAERSKEGCVEASVCWVESLEVKNSSIYLNVFSKSDTHTSEDFQFKYRDEKFQLIGYKTNKAYPAVGKNAPEKGIEIDRNLLTGRVVEKTQIGEKAAKIRTLRKKFSALYLRDFEFFYEDEIRQ
ncbi:MAG: hypothetical protein R2681_03455 [Pyrinomonadaceae bacterium]